jgi:uncharacterized protein (DUF1697 family)
MKTCIAFLRGINVGGANILPMKELKALCEKAGFKSVRTYIQSGNVIFESALAEATLTGKLEGALRKKMDKPIAISCRTVAELERVLENNPFPRADPAKVGVTFFPNKVGKGFLSGVSTTTGEEVKVGSREVYVHYPNGMGRSKLKMPKGAEKGTTRNVNTIRKIVNMCSNVEIARKRPGASETR